MVQKKILLLGDGAVGKTSLVHRFVEGVFKERYKATIGVDIFSKSTNNFLDGSHSGHNGKVYNYRDAFVVETQHFPDSPNHLNFPLKFECHFASHCFFHRYLSTHPQQTCLYIYLYFP